MSGSDLDRGDLMSRLWDEPESIRVYRLPSPNMVDALSFVAAMSVGVAAAPSILGGGCEHRPDTRLAKLPHTDTPKRLSKRRARRLRAKARAHASSSSRGDGE